VSAYGNTRPNTKKATISVIPVNTLALGSPLNAAARPPHEASLQAQRVALSSGSSPLQLTRVKLTRKGPAFRGLVLACTSLA
jgi:hypothetical protein